MCVQTCIYIVLRLVVVCEAFDFVKSHREESFLLPQIQDHADLKYQSINGTYLFENVSGRVAEEYELLIDE